MITSIRMQTSVLAVMLWVGGLVAPFTCVGADKLPPKQLQDYKEKAEKGDAMSQYKLGDYYLHGAGVQTNHAEAVKWFRKSADQNNALAECDLGNCYDCGVGVMIDHAEAVNWYRKAAEQGFAPAQYNLGNSYRNGSGVATNYIAAAGWYRKAAERGYAWAQFNLAHCYAEGLGVEVDGVEAYAWLTLAAKTVKEAAVSLAPFRAQLSSDQVKAAKKRVKQLEIQIDANLKSPNPLK